MKITPLTTLAALALLGSSSPAQSKKPGVLAHVRNVFAAIDANKDGKIDLAEATKERVATRDFTAQDVDKSASLDASEFLVYYRQLLVTAGQKVPGPLDAEIQRIEAERRKALEAERAAAAKRQAEAQARAENQRLEEERRLAAAESTEPAPAAGTAPVADPSAATGLVQRLVTGGTLSAEEGRDMLRGLSDPAGAAGDIQALEVIRGAVGRVQPRIQGLVQSGQLSAEEGRVLSATFLARATAAGAAIAALESGASPGASPGAATREPVAGAGSPAEPAAENAAETPATARQLLERLGQSGRLTRQEADAMALALQDPAQFAGDTEKLGQIRAAVNSTQSRLGALVQQGKLSAEEARTLSAAFQLRGQQAATALAGAGDAAGAQRAEPGARAGGPGGAGGPDGRAEAPATETMSPREAQGILGRLIAEGAIDAEEGSAWLGALGDQSGADRAQLQNVRDALAAARPRISALVQEGKLSAEEGRGLATWFNRRGKQVAKTLSNQQPGSRPGQGAAPERGLDEEAATGEGPGRRAQSYVRRLITEGRVSAAEGRVMFQAMTDPSTITGDATQLEGVRAALVQARPRIGELVRQGHLSVEEGRDLSSVFDARATAAAAALKSIQEPSEGPAPGRRPGGQPARGDQGGERAGNGAGRGKGRPGAQPAERPQRAGAKGDQAGREAGQPKKAPRQGGAQRGSGGAKREGGDAQPANGGARRGEAGGKRPAGGERGGEGEVPAPAARPAGTGKQRPGGGRPAQAPRKGGGDGDGGRGEKREGGGRG